MIGNRVTAVTRVLLTLAIGLLLISDSSEQPLPTRIGVWVLAVVVCSALLLAAAGRSGSWPSISPRVQTAALVVLAAAGWIACWLIPHGSGVAVPLLLARLVSQAPLAKAWRHVLIGSTALTLIFYNLVSDGPWWGFVAWPMAVAVIFQSGLRVQSRREQLESAELMLAAEEALRTEQVRAAATAERTRIARELHDVLAHTLSGLTVVLQATTAQLAAERASPAAQEQVGRARAMAVDGLAEARQAVASLDPGSQRSRADLMPVVDRQVREHQIITGTPARLSAESAPTTAPPAVVAAVSGIVRESLTNAVRHSPGAPVSVRIERVGDDLRVQIDSEPGRSAAAAGPGGMGVSGMVDRARELGGSLTAEPSDRGWRVQARIPLGVDHE